MANLKYTGLDACHVYETGKILRASELTNDAKQSLSATRLILENLKGYYANYDTDSEELLVNMNDEMLSEDSELYLKLSKAIEYSIKGITESKTSETAFSKLEVGKENSDSYAKIFTKGSDREYSIYTDGDGADIVSKFNGNIISKMFLSYQKFALERNYYTNNSANLSAIYLEENDIRFKFKNYTNEYNECKLDINGFSFSSSVDSDKNLIINNSDINALSSDSTYNTNFKSFFKSDEIQLITEDSSIEKAYIKMISSTLYEYEETEDESSYYTYGYRPLLSLVDKGFKSTLGYDQFGSYVEISKGMTNSGTLNSDYALKFGLYTTSKQEPDLCINREMIRFSKTGGVIQFAPQGEIRFYKSGNVYPSSLDYDIVHSLTTRSVPVKADIRIYFNDDNYIHNILFSFYTSVIPQYNPVNIDTTDADHFKSAFEIFCTCTKNNHLVGSTSESTYYFCGTGNNSYKVYQESSYSNLFISDIFYNIDTNVLYYTTYKSDGQRDISTVSDDKVERYQMLVTLL